MAERNYAFRRILNQVHRPDRRNPAATAQNAEAAIQTGWWLAVPQDASAYLVRVAQDLQDYLLVSMGVSVLLRRCRIAGVLAKSEPNAIVLGTAADLPKFGSGLTVPRSYRLVARKDAIVVCGRDERGVAQGCYYLEDVMNLREAPFLPMADTTRTPLFQPRMVHSGWGIDQFPDPHLNAIAHAGMDAILVFVKGVNRTTMGYLDFNDLVDRAAAYGLDVYLYSYLHSSKHPRDPDAEAYYETTYGDLMRSCPGAKGIVFVGESCEFPSRDERTKMRTRRCPVPPGGEDDRRPFPGWWPCRDYPEWLDLIKQTIRRANPACDIVFWTYNWGWAPAEERLALIRNLPTDISLQVTFEMFESIRKEGIPTRCVDYTASFEGPGTYFRTEAAAAKEAGIRLYAMANTAGLTWDIGVIPFQPIPFQWQRRYAALHEARERWGLQGLMESHHYGWWPSFVSELAKWSYWHPVEDFTAMAQRLAERDFGRDAAADVVEAWRLWSDAFRDYVPTNEDQYGPFRVGPSYPFVFLDQDVTFPAADYAHFGNRIIRTRYRSHAPDIIDGEIRLLDRLLQGWNKGLALLRQAIERVPERQRGNLDSLLRLGDFIRCCVATTLNVKRWSILNAALQEPGKSLLGRKQTLEAMVVLLRQEMENATLAIPLVEADSRLGWEPSMEYVTDRSHIEWKITQLRQVMETAIPAYRRDIEADGATADTRVPG